MPLPPRPLRPAFVDSWIPWWLEMAVEQDYQEDLKGLTAEPWRPPRVSGGGRAAAQGP